MKKYPLLELPGLGTIEAERGEVIVNPKGIAFQIDGKKHSKGGTKMVAEEGSVILSQHLKLPAPVSEALGQPAKAMSPAEISKKFPTGKYADIMEGDPKRYDDLAKRTASLMFDKHAAKQRQIFLAQEAYKAHKGKPSSLSKMQAGGSVPRYGPDDFIFNDYDSDPNGGMAEKKYSRNPPLTPLTGGFNLMGSPEPTLGGYTSEQPTATTPRSYVGPNTDPNFRDVNLYGFPSSADAATGELSDPLAPSGNLFSTERQAAKVGGKRDLSFVTEQDPMKLYSFANRDKYGYSMEDGLVTVRQKPLAGSPYFQQQRDILNSRPLTDTQKKVLAAHQDEISHLERYGTPDGLELGRAVAKYHREADKIEKDRFLTKHIELPDGSQVELINATDDQIQRAVKIRYKNLRTGQDDLVDLRDRQNQGPNPEMLFQAKPSIPTLEKLPSRNLGLKVPPGVPPVPTPPTPGVDDKPGMKQTTSVGNLVNGVQIGLLALDLATVRTKPPYYDYRASELAYTRYKPINTKQQERAFNIARESIMNSNLPETVKASQIAGMQASMREGMNQVDLANYQNALQNDNSNINRFFEVRQNDNLREQDANMRFVFEADRRRALADQQRQVYLTNVMDIWRQTVDNNRNLGLVNQLSPNYDYNKANNRVEYQRGTTPLLIPPSLAAYGRNQ